VNEIATNADGLRATFTVLVGSLGIDAGIDTGPGTLVVVGPNGAGKTTMLKCMLGLVRGLSGRLEVAGRVLFDGTTGVDVPLEQRRLGYVPQGYALFPHLSVRQNIEFAVASAGGNDRLSPTRRERAQRVEALMVDLGLAALADRLPAGLSGGEKQRVALARSLSVHPRALLLDEPLAALDVHSRAEVREFLRAYLRRVGLPSIVVTHDAEDARLLGDKLTVLEAGKITQTGTWAELVAQPKSRFVEEFVAR
jgi:molybdate transport system ATP-binding protein